MRSLLRIRHLVLAAVSTALLALAASRTDLLGSRVAEAYDGLQTAEPLWLWAAGVGFAATHVAGGLAWRSGLSACGTRTRRRDAVARYGVGSGLNAVAPAHLGSAARIVLFARVVEGGGGAWRVGGAGAAVGTVRTVWLAAVVAVAATLGAVPAWPLACLGVTVALVCALAAGSRRIRTRGRVAHLLDAFRELAGNRRALLSVAALTAAGMAAKLAAAATVAAALGIDDPLRAAFVLVPAVELAAVMPVTPGNAGVASAAVALALGAIGVEAPAALGAGIAFGAVETLAAVAVGVGGGLALSGAALPPSVRWGAASASVCALASVCAATLV